MLNRSASLAMSTSVLKALPGKLDIKRHSPSILYLCDGNLQQYAQHSLKKTSHVFFAVPINVRNSEQVIPPAPVSSQTYSEKKIVQAWIQKISSGGKDQVYLFSHQLILWMGESPY